MSRQGCEGSGKRQRRLGEENHGDLHGEGEGGWLGAGRAGPGWVLLQAQLGQRLFIWFLINQRKCLDQMGPLDCLPRAGLLPGPGSLPKAGLGRIDFSN